MFNKMICKNQDYVNYKGIRFFFPKEMVIRR